MELFIIICWSLLFVQVTQCEICRSQFLHILSGFRLQGTLKANYRVDSPISCALRCVNEEYCRAGNLIQDEKGLNCELYDTEFTNSEQIIKDERATIYSIIDVKDTSNSVQVAESVQTPPPPVENTPTIMALSTLSQNTPAILPSSPVILPSSTSTLQYSPPPAVACKAIFENDRASADGTYTVFAETANEAEVFCDMTGTQTGCGGGGWTFVMRTNGQRTTFKYSSFRWTDQNKYQPYYGKIFNSNEETKLSTYWSTPFTRICLGMSYNNNLGWAIINITSSSLHDLISTNTFHTINLSLTTWHGLITSETSLQEKCPVQGINVVRGGTGVRIGIIATKTCNVNSDYNSRLGFGMKGTSCGQDGTNSCGNDARCNAKPRDLSIKTMGYILVK